MKIINKLKNYHPSFKLSLLYFFIPILILAVLTPFKEEDIWFLIKHGEYVINHGFPHTDFLSMHSNLHFVMQQWLSSVIFYLTYHFFKGIGLKILLQVINIVFLYFLYKLCMLLSNNKYRLAILITIITDVLLLLFWIIRPWVFTFLNLIIVLYIMELFYRKDNKKVLLFLPLISLLQINVHSSMWLMLIVFMLPYIVDLIINKERKVIYLFFIIVVMLLVGFINPYGMENMLYVFSSYNQKEISYVVVEMYPPTIGLNKSNLFGNVLFSIVLSITMIYILCKKGKLKLRYFLLTMGTLLLALMNIRSIPLFILGGIFPLADYLEPYFKKAKIKDNIDNKKYALTIIFLIIYSMSLICFINSSSKNVVKDGIDRIIKDGATSKDYLYIKYDYGSYAEYRGLKPYVDTRAEVFIKNNNHKDDIFLEYASIVRGTYNYDEFINKYNFKYLLVFKDENLYFDVKKDINYKLLFRDKEYSVFKKK